MALDFLAGCVGGAAGVIVGHPLDTVKVRLQTQSPTNIKYRGTFHCLSTIVKKESVAGLYKGISSPLFGVAGVNALIFGVYGTLRPYVSGSPGNDALWAHFAAGSVSGAVQSVIASPMELVKTRMQISEESTGSKKLGPVDMLKGIYRNEGGLFRGVFKGWGITLGREIPGFGIYFASYEAMTRMGDGQVGTLGMLMAGGMAGVLSWIVTFPIDVVKTRLQCDDRGKYSGAFDCARKTYRSEGYRAFSRGLVSTVIRAFPTNAATFTVVTWIMRLAGEAQDDGIQDCRKYLDELLTETSRLQEKFEDSLRLKVPHYLHGNSLTSSSLASQCAASAQKYADRTQTYFNFYQTLVHAETEENEEKDEEEDVGVDARDKQVGLSIATTTSMQPSTASQSTCSLSSRRLDDNNQQHNRNIDNAVLHNNHIPSSSKSASSSHENRFESETYASPISGDDETESTDREDGETKSVSSLIQGNKVFSHEAASLPARRRATNNTSHQLGASTVNTNDTAGGAHLEFFNNDSRSLSQGDFTYLSKSLDIPVHILKAAASQQKNYNDNATASSNKTQMVVAKTATLARSSNLKAQAWRKYCKTPAVNLCKCFEDHCVCFL
ncbi:Mitochondrial basic amino acids transporter [Orchesella cincta]|uniref:Mitochondrial basic amino acids transporter n=1 Tax=Orchesella cincta TaxID=48709 RepID=A0A1D2NG81_ORCCI|nr:Mitochondrial basic amino acids transporter [Orchesella cincta]